MGVFSKGDSMTVPEAVEVARQHLITILPEYAEANLQLEELETPPFSSKWSFTFSATKTGAARDTVSLAQIVRGRLVYKSVQIDSDTGALLSVKNASA
jgi:hypothetical protein